MDKIHDIKEITFRKNEMIIIIDGKEYIFYLNKISDKLPSASSSELTNYKISPSGYGISWPLLDEDLSIDGLLEVSHKSPFINKKITA